MTKKDYIAIAEAFREAKDCASKDLTPMAMWWSIHSRVCELLKADNPRFDRDKFEGAGWPEDA